MALFKRKKTENKDNVPKADADAKEKKPLAGAADDKKGSQAALVIDRAMAANKTAATGSMKELYGTDGKAVKTVAKDNKNPKQPKKSGNADRVIIKPLITEKAANLGAFNQYVFEAAPKTNKIEIAKAVNDIYGIMPQSVNIIKMKGKLVRAGRYKGKRKDWKKAVITLPKGKSINIYEGV